jgi:hypothetical protein
MLNKSLGRCRSPSCKQIVSSESTDKKTAPVSMPGMSLGKINALDGVAT